MADWQRISELQRDWLQSTSEIEGQLELISLYDRKPSLKDRLSYVQACERINEALRDIGAEVWGKEAPPARPRATSARKSEITRIKSS